MSSANRKRLKLPGIEPSSSSLLEANSKLYDKSSSSSVSMIEIYRIVMRDGFQYIAIE
jgi:hypothetical protein